jgi:transcriptional regulator with XRE-family HTH domain
MRSDLGRLSPLAEALRAARVRRGMSQDELAQRLGVSQATVSFWERGIESPSVEKLITLASELPEVLGSVEERERELLRRLLRVERELFDGRCACRDCSCRPQNEGGSALLP